MLKNNTRSFFALGILLVCCGFSAAALAQTTIVVNTVTDPDSDSSTTTCGFEGALGSGPANDGLCSLRRAIIDANLRPAEDRPITIGFDLPAADANAVAGTWTINVDGGLPAISTLSSITDPDSMVTIDGATQPGARAQQSGPPVFINSDSPFSLLRAKNTIKNIGIFGGASLQLNRVTSANTQVENVVENIWMNLSEDGQRIVFVDSLPDITLAGGGIAIQQSDGNVIRNNVVAGTPAGAILINTGDDNEISGNMIGMRADGTVPETIDCTPSRNFSATNWYGGVIGIDVSGTGNQILNNTIAGLNHLRSATETAPIAIDVNNARDHRVQGNKIGVDGNGNRVGLCGGALNVFGATQTAPGSINRIEDNTIFGSRRAFPDSPLSEAVIFIGSGSGFTMRNNLIDSATLNAISFTTTVDAAWRNFVPAQIIAVNGQRVIGGSAANSPCPNCIVDLYLDDADGREEALELLATVTADADGNFSADLPRELAPLTGIRTISTAQADDVIPGFRAGTSTRISRLFSETIFADQYEE